MKKVTLTENDLIRIIKKVIKEQGENPNGYNEGVVAQFVNNMIKGKTFSFKNRNQETQGESEVLNAGAISQKREDGKGNMVIGLNLMLKGIDGRFPGMNKTKQVNYYCNPNIRGFNVKIEGRDYTLYSDELDKVIKTNFCGKLKEINQTGEV